MELIGTKITYKFGRVVWDEHRPHCTNKASMGQIILDIVWSNADYTNQYIPVQLGIDQMRVSYKRDIITQLERDISK